LRFIEVKGEGDRVGGRPDPRKQVNGLALLHALGAWPISTLSNARRWSVRTWTSKRLGASPRARFDDRNDRRDASARRPACPRTGPLRADGYRRVRFLSMMAAMMTRKAARRMR
jgi:hypothetical protein